MKHWASLASALFAAIAAGCWLMSTIVETSATGESGIGAGFGGYIVVKNAKGRPIHFVDTFQKQARWSGWAARAAAVAAGFQAIYAFME